MQPRPVEDVEAQDLGAISMARRRKNIDLCSTSLYILQGNILGLISSVTLLQCVCVPAGIFVDACRKFTA